MKVQTPLRFEKDLIERVKEKAKANKRSLNNYIEYLLYKDVGDIPNDMSQKAIEDARSGKDTFAIDDLNAFMNDL